MNGDDADSEDSLAEVLGQALDRDPAEIERRAREEMPILEFDELELAASNEDDE